MNEKELISLVNLAAKKDNAALEKLYNRYYTDIIFICRKYNLSDAALSFLAARFTRVINSFSFIFVYSFQKNCLTLIRQLIVLIGFIFLKNFL